MAQFDLLLTQNTHATLVEFTERYVNITKGGLLSADAGGVPNVLAPGTDGYILSRSAAATSGLAWIANTGGHTQGTDLGTTSTVFGIDTDGFDIELTAESASKFGVKVTGGATYADMQAKDATFNTVQVSTAPASGNYLTNKTYVDGLLAANDAMVFKGSLGVGGTLTGATFTALTSYGAGETYKVITAATYTAKAGDTFVAEIGDLVICVVDRAGAGWTAGDWIVVQTNIDGAVVGPASATANAIALFNSTTGKLIKDSAKTIVTVLGADDTTVPTSKAVKDVTDLLVTKALYDANTILIATADNTPIALAVGASTVLGRKASGDISAMTAAETMAVLWQTAPGTKTTAGTAGWIAKDSNFIYVCTATNVWARAAIATNW